MILEFGKKRWKTRFLTSDSGTNDWVPSVQVRWNSLERVQQQKSNNTRGKARSKQILGDGIATLDGWLERGLDLFPLKK